MPIRIRDAAVHDVAAIARIQNALIGSTTYEWREAPYSLDDRRAWFAAKSAGRFPVLVAEDDGAADDEVDGVVGFATYGDFRDIERWPGYRFTVEHTVHVAEAAWGRGVGRLLLDELSRRAAAAGKRTMIAAVDASNTGSIAFHERVGFVESGRLREVGEKFGTRLDLVLLQRAVPATGTPAP